MPGNSNFGGRDIRRRKARPFDLHGRVALVTGGGRGLGAEIAKGLAASGAHVLINGRQLPPLEQTAADVQAFGRTAEPLAFDVTDEAATAAAFARIEGRLDILVNNAGMRDRRGLYAFTLDDARQMFAANLVAPCDLSRRAAKFMTRQDWGRIINITSIAGPIAREGDALYTIAKGGLGAMTRALAAEFGLSGITVNAIAPGYFATPANATMVTDAAITDCLTTRTSLARWGDPAEIARAVVFLASPAASYVTGQVLAVDGGYLAHF